jgi:hypothetical protein
MSLKDLVAKVKRNTGLLEDLDNASVVRIAYKTDKGWKRLRVPKSDAAALRRTASSIVEKRLDKLVPEAQALVVDAALDDLVAQFNGR